MPELKSKITEESLVLRDPRRYAVKSQQSSLMDALRRACQMHVHRSTFDNAVSEARTHIENGQDDFLNEALLSMRTGDDHAAAKAVLSVAACRSFPRNRKANTVHLVFAIPLTVHPESAPFTGAQPRRDWLNFDALKSTLLKEEIILECEQLVLLPHLFSIEDLDALSWSTWHKLSTLLPVKPQAALSEILPAPQPLAPVETRKAQARLILGAMTCSLAEAEYFVEEATVYESEYAALLTEKLQEQLGFDSGIRVVVGIPAVAIAAVSNAQHMFNCAQLSCLTNLSEDEGDEQLSLKAEALSDEDGEGQIRFSHSSGSMTWVMSKSEPWEALQMHWTIILQHLSARYLKLQLGISPSTLFRH